MMQLWMNEVSPAELSKSLTFQHINYWNSKQPNMHVGLTEMYNNFWKGWRNSIHFGVSVTFVLFRIERSAFAEHKWSYLFDWAQGPPPPPPPYLFQDKSHPLKEYDSALNVLPEILMSGPIARFHCNKCWYTFMWWSCLCSWGCFPAGSTINSFKGRSDLNQADIYHRVMKYT